MAVLDFYTIYILYNFSLTYFDFHTEILGTAVNGWSTFKVVSIKHIKQAYQNYTVKDVKSLPQGNVCIFR